jgi:hypothetical protein
VIRKIIEYIVGKKNTEPKEAAKEIEATSLNKNKAVKKTLKERELIQVYEGGYHTHSPPTALELTICYKSTKGNIIYETYLMYRENLSSAKVKYDFVKDNIEPVSPELALLRIANWIDKNKDKTKDDIISKTTFKGFGNLIKMLHKASKADGKITQITQLLKRLEAVEAGHD